jgi:glycosyltransferase involved in cell wall biosynthesis
MARAAAGLSRALAKRGHEVTVVTALLDPSHRREEHSGGVRVVRFDGPAFLRRRFVPWAPALREFLRASVQDIDVAHLHGHRNGLAWTASRELSRAGRRYVLQPHGTFPRHAQKSAAKALLDRLAGNRIVAGATALVAVSDAEARELPRPARVVPNGVEACGAARRERVPGELLFVGSDAFQKRAQLLPQLLAELPCARLRLVGRFAPSCLWQFAALGERVRVSGVLNGDALAAAYAAAALVVHPAVGEAFGLVPFEAALHGAGAVVAGGHGCGEWYGRAGGCVVPADDAAALAAAVQVRLDDPTKADAEAERVAGFARRELTWERAAQGVEAIYAEVLRADG